MAQTTTISFALDERTDRTEVPATLWTDFVVDGRRIFIRTQRPVPLLGALCASALDMLFVNRKTDKGLVPSVAKQQMLR